jgi:hypothetical protein
LGVDVLKSEGEALPAGNGAELKDGAAGVEEAGWVEEEAPNREGDAEVVCSVGFAPNKGFDGV